MKKYLIITAAWGFNSVGMILAMSGSMTLSFIGGMMVGLFGLLGGRLLSDRVRGAQ